MPSRILHEEEEALARAHIESGLHPCTLPPRYVPGTPPFPPPTITTLLVATSSLSARLLLPAFHLDTAPTLGTLAIPGLPVRHATASPNHNASLCSAFLPTPSTAVVLLPTPISPDVATATARALVTALLPSAPSPSPSAISPRVVIIAEACRSAAAQLVTRSEYRPQGTCFAVDDDDHDDEEVRHRSSTVVLTPSSRWRSASESQPESEPESVLEPESEEDTNAQPQAEATTERSKPILTAISSGVAVPLGGVGAALLTACECRGWPAMLVSHATLRPVEDGTDVRQLVETLGKVCPELDGTWREVGKRLAYEADHAALSHGAYL